MSQHDQVACTFAAQSPNKVGLLDKGSNYKICFGNCRAVAWVAHVEALGPDQKRSCRKTNQQTSLTTDFRIAFLHLLRTKCPSGRQHISWNLYPGAQISRAFAQDLCWQSGFQYRVWDFLDCSSSQRRCFANARTLKRRTEKSMSRSS